MGYISMMDNLNGVKNKIGFFMNMFNAADPRELEFNEESLCGLCQILREIYDLIDNAEMNLEIERTGSLSVRLRSAYDDIMGSKDKAKKILEIDRNLNKIREYFSDLQMITEWNERFSGLKNTIIQNIWQDREKDLNNDLNSKGEDENETGIT